MDVNQDPVNDGHQVDNVGDQDQNGDTGTKDKVAYDTYRRVLGKLKDAEAKLEKLNEYEAKAAEAEKIKAEAEEVKLKSEGKWKELLEAKENKLKELDGMLAEERNKVQSFQDHLQEATKLQALQDVLGGRFKKQRYFDLVETDKIAINPETGQVDNDSLKAYADSFLKEHKELIEFNKPQMPDGAAHAGGLMDYQEWVNKVQNAKGEELQKLKSMMATGKVK